MKDRFIIRGEENHYEVVDFLKGFSIITITIMHLIQNYIQSCPKIISKVSSLGGTGVHVFFYVPDLDYLLHIKKNS